MIDDNAELKIGKITIATTVRPSPNSKGHGRETNIEKRQNHPTATMCIAFFIRLTGTAS
jgi:hypothetical protein